MNETERTTFEKTGQTKSGKSFRKLEHEIVLKLNKFLLRQSLKSNDVNLISKRFLSSSLEWLESHGLIYYERGKKERRKYGKNLEFIFYE